MSACPRPGVRRGPRRGSGGHPCRPLTPCVLVGAARARAGVRGRRGGPGSGRRVAGGGSTPVLAPRRLPVAGGASPRPGARSRPGRGGAWSCAMRGLTSSALRAGGLRGPAAGRAAGRAVPPQGQASNGGHGAAGRASTARWYHAPSTPGPCAAAVAMVHGPPGRAAVGHREARAPASVSSHPTRVCRRRETALIARWMSLPNAVSRHAYERRCSRKLCPYEA